MLAIGGLLISLGLLTIAVLVPMFRRSDPPRWTTRGWVGELVTVGLVSTLALGAACFGAGAVNAFQAGPDFLQLSLLAVVLLGAIVIRPRLHAWAQSKAPAASMSRPMRASTPPAPDKAA